MWWRGAGARLVVAGDRNRGLRGSGMEVYFIEQEFVQDLFHFVCRWTAGWRLRGLRMLGA